MWLGNLPATKFIPRIESVFVKWLREDRHLSQTTVETKLSNLRRLRKRVNIWDIDSVHRYIAGSEWGNNYKSIMEYMYRDWCQFNGFDYKLTKYPKDTKIPYVPLEKDIDILIAGFKNSKYPPMLQLLKESGFRPEEAFRLTPNDFDLEQKICTLNKPAKHSLPRQFKMSDKLVAMINPLVITRANLFLSFLYLHIYLSTYDG
jgi:integrase